MKQTYFYRNEETANIEMLAESQLWAFFNAPFNLREDKKNGTTFQDFVVDSERAGLLYPFNLNSYLETYVCDLPPILQEYVIQECEKVFNNTPWIDTEEELENVAHEKLKNITPDTIDLSKFL